MVDAVRASQLTCERINKIFFYEIQSRECICAHETHRCRMFRLRWNSSRFANWNCFRVSTANALFARRFVLACGIDCNTRHYPNKQTTNERKHKSAVTCGVSRVHKPQMAIWLKLSITREIRNVSKWHLIASGAYQLCMHCAVNGTRLSSDSFAGHTQVHGHASNCDPNRHFTRLLSCSLSILTCTFSLSLFFHFLWPAAFTWDPNVATDNLPYEFHVAISR